MSGDKGDYQVGYGRPPKEHRFQKGQSGNARGRPKGARNFRTDVLETLEAPVPIVENGNPRTVSTQRAVLLRLREKALKGDPRALDQYLRLAGAYNNDEPAHGPDGQLPDADRAIIDRAMARLSATDRASQNENTLPEAESTPGTDHNEHAGNSSVAPRKGPASGGPR